MYTVRGLPKANILYRDTCKFVEDSVHKLEIEKNIYTLTLRKYVSTLMNVRLPHNDSFWKQGIYRETKLLGLVLLTVFFSNKRHTCIKHF